MAITPPFRRATMTDSTHDSLNDSAQNQKLEKMDNSYKNRLYPEDQAKVDGFLQRGVNDTPRKPFRPLRLVLLLIVVVTGLSFFSQLIARWAGVY